MLGVFLFGQIIIGRCVGCWKKEVRGWRCVVERASEGVWNTEEMNKEQMAARIYAGRKREVCALCVLIYM